MNSIFGGTRLNNTLRLILFLIIVSFISPNLIYSQKGSPPDPREHNEFKDDDYVPDLRDSQERSPAYNYRMYNILTTQVNVDANGLNIVGDAANEPSIAVDPNNNNRIAIGWRQFNTITSNFRQAGYGFTTNGGQTWTFPGVIEPGIFRSDPVLESDNEGTFYYNSLTTSGQDYLCHVFKSDSGGSSWGSKVFAQGGDKQWMAIDRTNGPGAGNIYAYWTSFYSVCPPGFFTRSTNNALSFEDCVTIPQDPFWGTLTVASTGELYVGGSIGDDFLVAKSINAQNPGQTVSWSMATVVDLDGFIANGYGPNPGGLLGQTQIAVDTSGGPTHGNIYLLCSVERASNNDPLDVMFARSTNGGVNWSSPVKINNDPGTSAYQWFGTMSVAPNGRIDVVWLDTRDNPGTNLSALYYANSHDAGITWSQNYKISESFNPHLGWPQQNKMGDYFDMISENEGAHLSWAATFTGGQDVYYSYISDSTIVPVEFVSFTAFAAPNVVTLDWSTATEINNRGFEITRSTDQNNWITIAFREGVGTTSEPQNYSYSDNVSGIPPSKLYYRLKQLDYDGGIKYSNILEVDVAPSEFALSQNYPNPFNPITSISYEVPVSGLVTLKVYDVLGNEVASLVNEQKPAGKYESEFNASGLTSGIYFYSLRSGSSGITKKMILMK